MDVAVRYWSSYPEEIAAWIADADSLEAEALAACEPQQALFAWTARLVVALLFDEMLSGAVAKQVARSWHRRCGRGR